MKMKPYPKNIRAWHDAWTCRYTEEVVRAAAVLKNTPEAEIVALLQWIEKPWKAASG